MTTTMTTTTQHTEDTELDVDDLVLKRASIDEAIARLQDEKDIVNARIIEELGDGTHETRHAKVVISRRGTLNNKKLEEAYPQEQFPQLYTTTTKLATDQVKKEFAPAALESFKTYSAPSVTIKA